MSECACHTPTPVLDEVAGETVCSKCARVLDDSMEQPCKNQGQNHMVLGNRVSSTKIQGNAKMRRASRCPTGSTKKEWTRDIIRN